MTETPKPENIEFKKTVKYMDNMFDIIFKIESNCDLEILAVSESGISFASEKFNVKKASLDFELFSNLIKEEDNWKLGGDFNKGELTITIFKIIKLTLNMVNNNENSQKIIQYLCRKVNDLSKEISLMKEKNNDKTEIKIIPLNFANGWKDYGYGFSPGRIIKKGNEITLSGLISGTNFSTVCVLPEDCRPKNILIFSLNHHNTIMRFDVNPNGNVTYSTGTNSYNWISLDGIHFFAGI
jgi:hypothetical protein